MKQFSKTCTTGTGSTGRKEVGRIVGFEGWVSYFTSGKFNYIKDRGVNTLKLKEFLSRFIQRIDTIIFGCIKYLVT